MNLRFVKMHGCGNDYIFCDLRSTDAERSIGQADRGKLAVRMSDRHYGIGADGLVLILPSDRYDARMQMFNADGSEGRMCGNALRCVGRYLQNSGRTARTEFSIETRSGVRRVRVPPCHREPVTAEMGHADFDPRSVPLHPSVQTKLIGANIQVGEHTWKVTALSVGNPHCVLFDIGQTLPSPPVAGPAVAACGLFPCGVNVSFVKRVSATELRVRVWERGSGETLACGTGACAAVAAAAGNGFCRTDTDILCRMRGGDLTVRYRKDGILLTGEAKTVFFGEYPLDTE